MPHNVLQEYFESLADTDGHPDRRLEKVLNSYAELQYRLNGSGKCSMCRATVRHVMPVRVKHTDGTIGNFDCLCTRCLEAERAISERVDITVGKATLTYTHDVEPPKTQKFTITGL